VLAQQLCRKTFTKEITGSAWYHCLAHRLNLAVTYALGIENKCTDNTNKLGREFVKLVRAQTKVFTSAKQNDKLFDLQEESRAVTVVIGMVVRWCSTVAEFIRLLRLYKPVKAFYRTLPVGETKIKAKEFHDWVALAQIVAILDQFRIMNISLQRRDLCMGEAMNGMLAAFISLLHPFKVQKFEVDGEHVDTPAEGLCAVADSVYKRLMQELEDRVILAEHSTAELTAIFLDPVCGRSVLHMLTQLQQRVKAARKDTSHTPDFYSLARERVLRMVRHCSPMEAAQPAKKQRLDDVGGCYSVLALPAGPGAASADGGSVPAVSAAEAELELYAQEAEAAAQAPPQHYSIFKWWQGKVKEGKFATLSHIARTTLAMRPTSVEPERNFSLAGVLVAPKRSSMKPERVETMLMLKANSDLVEKPDDVTRLSGREAAAQCPKAFSNTDVASGDELSDDDNDVEHDDLADSDNDIDDS
jgi:hAT family C-terminal dimerisation region